MSERALPTGARRILLGPLWQWLIVLAVMLPAGVALAAWGGAFGSDAEDAARAILKVWAAVLFAVSAAWLVLVLPGVVLSTLAARRRKAPGLVGQGAVLFWAGVGVALTALAASAAMWLGVGGWPR